MRCAGLPPKEECLWSGRYLAADGGDTRNCGTLINFHTAVTGAAAFYARNDHLEFTIPYEYLGVSNHYEPDFLVRLSNGTTLVIEIKGS